MTNQEILEKARKKALVNGWKPKFYVIYTINDATEPIVESTAAQELEWRNIAPVLFEKDFAKALWGEEPCYTHTGEFDKYGDDKDYLPLWQHHLRQMVIAPDPTAYLADNIE